MRMWMVPTNELCRKHLLGEHVETHMLLGSIQRGRNLQGFISGGLIATASLQKRHDELATEIKTRGYHHASPMTYVDTLNLGHVDPKVSRTELARRCTDCEQRQRGLT